MRGDNNKHRSKKLMLVQRDSNSLTQLLHKRRARWLATIKLIKMLRAPIATAIRQ
jgi:hypothetical protein